MKVDYDKMAELYAAEAHARGIGRTSEDLLRGPIECSSQYTMLWATR
ncbi:MAG TPA: hypothetical protein VFO40_06840 [Chthoniobacterales bacterium]|nr:hypothetical protein [Chthoniobacterales bacterium]